MGHNGAGKTTTFSMLSGMTTSSSGRVLICQKDIVENLAFCQENIGYCPQYNPLFDKLTVSEHLKFYAKLKGFEESNINDEIRRLTHSVGLNKKIYTVNYFILILIFFYSLLVI